VDVIIIGAGWAGMAAADHLARHAGGPNDVTFAILESTHRTGGRTEAVSLGGHIVEAGSSWIGGALSPGQSEDDACTLPPEDCPQGIRTNPIMDIAVKAGIDFLMSYEDDGGLSSESGAGQHDLVPNVLDKDGKTDLDQVSRQKFEIALECLDDADVQMINSFTIRQALAHCGWNPKSDIEWAIDVAATECSGAENDVEIADGISDLFTLELWGYGAAFVTEQHPRGYARILDEMTKDTIPKGDPRLVLNSHVHNIEYNQLELCNSIDHDNIAGQPCAVAPVVVTTEDGRVYHAQHVISTLPLGVLQRHHETLFTPSLPDQFVKALSSKEILMRNVTKVYLQFPTVWWDNTLTRWVSVNHGANDTASADHFSRWRNINYVQPGSNILLCFLGDPHSSYYEAMPDDQVQVAAMTQLRQQHPKIDIPDPTNFYISRHGYDRTRYGAFPVHREKWSGAYEVFDEPIKDSEGVSRIHFAGEAFCPLLSGYTHGALLSGRHAAASYLFDRDIGPDPKLDDGLILCWWTDRKEEEDEAGERKDDDKVGNDDL
jgi:monoamine oxidase